MDQTNKLNNQSIILDDLSKIDCEVLVEGDNEIVITNSKVESSSVNTIFNIHENANLKLTLFDLSNEDINNLLTFDLEQNSNVEIVIINLSKKVTNNQITVNLNGQNSQSNVNVISVAKDQAKTKFNVICNNNAPHTSANIMQRAVALNGGENIFEATGYIAKDCAKAKNFQESRVLLLDGAATGDASPLLLINHHDVEAGHAAGVSRVNDEEMYYLMSRGIDRRSAEELMTIAFIRPVIDKIDDEKLRESIFTQVNKQASYETN